MIRSLFFLLEKGVDTMFLTILSIVAFIIASIYLITASIKQNHRSGLRKYKNNDESNEESLLLNSRKDDSI